MTDLPICGSECKKKKGCRSEKVVKTGPHTHGDAMEKGLVLFLSRSDLVSDNCQALLLPHGFFSPQTWGRKGLSFSQNKHKTIYLPLKVYSSTNISVCKYLSHKSKEEITGTIATLSTEYQATIPT